MATTHELLSHGNWRGAGLRALIEAVLQSHLRKGGSPVDLQGPNLVLTPAAASTLGLVFYELTTNATKYGSLSGENGRVKVAWHIEETTTPSIVIEWIESEGPPVKAPIEAGFGAGFVIRSIEYELGGKAESQPDPSGLRWTIRFPLQRNVQQQAAAVAPQ